MINILTTEEKNRLNREYWMRFATVILCFVSLISIIASILLLPSYFFSKSKETFATQSLENFIKNNPEAKNNDLTDKITDMNNKLVLLDSINFSNNFVQNTISNIVDLKPSGIRITQIMYNEQSPDSNHLEIRGIAKDRTTLNDFKQIIAGNSNFKDVNLPLSDFVKPTNINFTIGMTLK